MTCGRRTALVCFSVLAAACAAATTSAAAADLSPYVALGDSYTAAPLVPTQHGSPVGCYRSTNNYPSLVARAYGIAQVRDVSCSSAETGHMKFPQPVLGGANPPQFDSLGKDAKLVTVGIGGNDAGLVGAAIKCLQLGLLDPNGTSCRDFYAPGGNDSIEAKITATAPRIAAVLQTIHERSPDARVAIVGYPAVAPQGGSCHPLVPLSPDDLRYLDGMLVRINAMIRTQASLNDAEFVPTYADSIGHDVCTPPGTRWFEGLLPTSLAYPIHPNALGEASMARSVVKVLDDPRPAPAISALSLVRRNIKPGRAAGLRYTINRAAGVTVTLRRAVRGARVGAKCVVRKKRHAARPGCVRYSRVLRTLRADAALGDNTLKLRATALKRAARYRITVTATSGRGELVSAAKLTHVRVKRPR